MPDMLQSFLEVLYNNAVAQGRWTMFLDGLIVTLQISFGAVVLGLAIGLAMAALRLSGSRSLVFVSKLYIGIIRGTPVVIQLLIVNALLFPSVRGAGLWVGIVAIGINSGAYVCEIVRAGILSVNKGQSEAGRSLGLGSKRTMAYVVIPQAIKNILPALANEFIVLIKETAIVGMVAVTDLTRAGQQIMSRTFNVTPLFISAFAYLIIVAILTFFLGKLEKWLRASDAR